MATSSASNPSPASRKETDRLGTERLAYQFAGQTGNWPYRGDAVAVWHAGIFFQFRRVSFYSIRLQVKGLTHLVSEIICVLSHSLALLRLGLGC